MTSYELGVCPACTSPRHTVIATQDELKAEVEHLWRFQLRRRHRDVPPDQLYDRAFFSQDPPLQLVACDDCGTVFRNPRESSTQLVELYADEEPDERVYQQLFEAQRSSYEPQARLLTRLAGRVGTGLEVGSYIGAFLTAANAHGWQFEGIDVNASASEFARSKGLTVYTASLSEAPRDRNYDAVAIWNCFDQLPDPPGTLADAHERMRVGGLLALRVPNGEFYARHRTNQSPLGRALLAYNNLLAFPYRQGFTPRSLQSLLERRGFAVIHVRPDVLVPTADSWTKTWARVEERMFKRVLRWSRLAPWFEVYGVKRE